MEQILEVFLIAVRAGVLPGLVAGAIALPLMSSTGLIFKFSLGAVLGGIGAALFQGYQARGSFNRTIDLFANNPSLGSDALGSVLFAGLVGIAVGGLLVCLVYETMKTILGAFYGLLIGFFAGLALYFIQTNTELAIDPRMITMIIGGVVFALVAAVFSGTTD